MVSTTFSNSSNRERRTRSGSRKRSNGRRWRRRKGIEWGAGGPEG